MVEVHVLDAGHFALDEEPATIARLTRKFLMLPAASRTAARRRELGSAR